MTSTKKKEKKKTDEVQQKKKWYSQIVEINGFSQISPLEDKVYVLQEII